MGDQDFLLRHAAGMLRKHALDALAGTGDLFGENHCDPPNLHEEADRGSETGGL